MRISTIDASNPHCTFINFFTVTPDKQNDVVELLRDATDRVISRFPGFVSANIHASTDGLAVVNYVQWRDREAFAALFDDPAAVEHMHKIGAMIVKSEKHFFEVSSIHQARD